MMCKIERASHFCVAIKTVMPKGAPRAVETGEWVEFRGFVVKET